ncbi:hypothetical protein J2I47_11155 [Fibrella sp. HMF5335]|uniref:Curlin associated repeat-containing protein n=1 Tax=Fibrella rubiginis TaxID=2817060 RepID=A0A939K385_9BACT|nr:hypothetical protein [Fibrella rubiginis]MBO0937104.1 hypothetical protein [Fibrella rubiginis]
MSLISTATVGWSQGNTTILTQLGNSMTANASQTGTGLTAIISQTASSPTFNTGLGATITQNGTDHNAIIRQDDNSEGNVARIVQMGNAPGSNMATISQSSRSGGTGARGTDPARLGDNLGNYAISNQTGAGNQVSISQDGTNTIQNYAFTEQFGTGNGMGSTGPVRINQNSSNDNRAEIRQGTAAVNVSGNGAVINQQGTSHSDNLTNDAFITQLSNNNQATILQTNTLIGSGTNVLRNNVASIQQEGAGNHVATITQSARFAGDAIWPFAVSPNAFGMSSSTSTVSQTGFGNTTDVMQAADAYGVTATVTQSGSGQVALANQVYGSRNNAITITQAGSNNHALINQYGSDTYFSDGNKATIAQYGDTHRARIDQLSTNIYATGYGEATIRQGTAGTTSTQNSATITQLQTWNGTATVGQNLLVSGGNNLAVGNQTYSTTNKLIIRQEGSYNVAILTQQGGTLSSGNTGTVTQTGTGNVLQNGAGAAVDGSFAQQNGTGNVLTVTQTGSPLSGMGTVSNVANVNQVGINQTAIITQSAN